MKMQHIIAAITLGVLSAVSVSVIAEDRPLEPENALTRDAEVYSEDFGVDLDTAMYRLGIQTEIGDLDTILELSEKEDFAGLYIQNEPVYHIFVLYKHHKYKQGNKGKKGKNETFNGRLNARLAKTKWRNFVKLRKVKYTLTELEDLQSNAVELAESVGIPADTSVDVTKNSVELAVTDIDAFNGALANEGLTLPDGMSLVEVDELITAQSIYGGLPLNNGSCTVGFGVKNSSGTKGIVTAAHCPNVLSFDGTNLPFQLETNFGSADLQWHTAPGLTVENDVRTGSLFGVTTSWRNMYGTVNRSAQSVGSQVCKYGNTTGYGCGTIQSKIIQPFGTSTVSPNATFVSVSKNGATLTAGGDSGGSWFNNNSAYGVHKGGSPTISIYTPIDYISILGLTILTN